MESLTEAFAGLLLKISDPVVIVLLILLTGSEYMRLLQSREERRDRQLLVDGLASMTEKITDSLHEIRNVISARTGNPL